MCGRIILKLLVVAAIIACPTTLLYVVTDGWVGVRLFWIIMFSILILFLGLTAVSWLLKKALLFLGFKEETLEKQYGYGYWGWRQW